MACHFERSDRYGMMTNLLFYNPYRFLLHDQLLQPGGYVHYQVLCNVVQHVISMCPTSISLAIWLVCYLIRPAAAYASTAARPAHT